MAVICEENKPLVSVIIPVYNGSNFLREAIDSVLAQTYKRIEIIVVNDGSNDNGETEKIAYSYGERINYIKKKNGGVSSALNVGILAMHGDYFAWLSHDDYYLPDKIENQVRCSDFNTIVMCGRFLVDSQSQILGDVRERFRFHKDITLDSSSALIALFKQGCFNGCSLLIPKHVFDVVGLFDESLRYCQDFLMWIKIFLEGYQLRFINKKLFCSRVHAAQLTNTNRELFHSDSDYICNIVINDICSQSTNKNNVLYYYTRYNALYNNKAVVDRCILIGKKNNLLKISNRCMLHIISFYGSLRPVIRRIYYKFFKSLG